MIGETILHYKILEKLGEGGMGTVYKAQDTKLERFVALKFLPFQLTATEDVKARFVQEAKAASAMNHPNVCTIYDIQEHNGQIFIVMEFIDGVTLRNNKQNLSEKRILDVANQIAEGLAAAHEKGIVHRDIKPENIMIRKDGIVQIMDFGLAKLFSTGNDSRLTKLGTTMGTIGYMSPEQVQGLDVDHRTDIFSLGVVLYEMLAGESPFKGMHETAIMYEIVNVDASPISTIKEEIDPQLDQIILECLEKEKDDRCQSAKELAKNLRKIKRVSSGNRTSRMYNVNSNISRTSFQQNTVTNLSGPLVYDDVPMKKILRNIVYNRKILWIGLSIFFSATILLLILFVLNSSSTNSNELASIKSTIQPPDGNHFSFSGNAEGGSLEISPNGEMIAFVATDTAGENYLWVRQLNALTAQKLTGTKDAYYPFWSYDSKTIAYFAEGKLKKIIASGGPSITICKAVSGRGGSWNKDDVIVFGPDQGTTIFKVAAGGGEPVQITKLDTLKNEATHRWPYFLPDGKHFIFLSRVSGVASSENDQVYISSLDGKETKKLFVAHSNLAFADNKILYVQDNTLMAQPFDADDLELIGTAVPIEENLLFSTRFNRGVFSVSQNSILLYQKGNTLGGLRLAFYDRNGKQENVFNKPDDYRNAKLSPDGEKIALVIYDESRRNSDIWIYDIKRNLNTRLTFSPGNDRNPVWSPDNKNIIFSSDRNNGRLQLFLKSANGVGDDKQITNLKFPIFVTDWSLDNKYISFAQSTPKTGADIYTMHVEKDMDTNNIRPEVFLNSEFQENGGRFSPDGKWLVYASNESGRFQHYVRPFPGPGGKWQISTVPSAPGYFGLARSGNEYFYRSANNKIISVEVKANGSAFDVGSAKELFELPYSGQVDFDGVSSDSKHFLLRVPVQINSVAPLIIVTNWNKNLMKKID